MTRLLLSLFFCIIILAGCITQKKAPERIWFYIDSKNFSEAYLDISPASFLNLEPGGTYTRDFGKFDHGRWEMKDGSLHLTGNDNNSAVYPVKFPSATELQLNYPRLEGEGFEDVTWKVTLASDY